MVFVAKRKTGWEKGKQRNGLSSMLATIVMDLSFSSLILMCLAREKLRGKKKQKDVSC